MPRLVVPGCLQLIRLLYETEVQYSVHYVQSAALGRRIQMQDCKGIDWESMDRDGKALRVESLEEMEQLKDPADPQPPGTCRRQCSQKHVIRQKNKEFVPNPVLRKPGCAGGGSGASTGRQEGGHHSTTAAQDRITRGHPYMFGVGRAGNLGMVTRAPPLAGLEFSTTLADGLETHSLAGLRRVFACASPGNKSSNVLLWAVRAQALRRVVTAACIKHNQVRSAATNDIRLGDLKWMITADELSDVSADPRGWNSRRG